MKQSHPWTIARHWVDVPGAQRRWDRAYQLVLHMAAERRDEIGTGTAPMGVELCGNLGDGLIRRRTWVRCS